MTAFSVSTSPLSSCSAGTAPLGLIGEIVASVLELLGPEVDALGLVVEADLVEKDVRCLAARAGR